VDKRSWKVFSSTPDAPWQLLGAERLGGVPGEDVLVIDLERTRQTIEGWGGCFNELGWQALSCLDEGARTEIMGGLFGPEGCNFDYCRMPIGASDYALDYYSLNDTDGDYAMENFSLERDRRWLIPFIRKAMESQPRLRVWGSPWTPPAWMKTNRQYHKGELRWEEPVLKAYALYFEKYVKAYRAEGIDIRAIHVQNEPFHLPDFPSCGWTGEHMRDFIRDYLGPRFALSGLDQEIWLGTINGPGDPDVPWRFIDTVLRDVQAASMIAGVGFQWFGMPAVDPTVAKYPGKKIMQTEAKCGDGSNDWAYAMETARDMIYYFNHGATAFMQWNMVLDHTGNSTWGWKQSTMVTVDTEQSSYRYNPQFCLVKHFSNTVKSGAKSVFLESDACCAFMNPDGSTVVFLMNAESYDKVFTLQVGEIIKSIVLPANSFNTVCL
jgi:glucosylceramidase